ncbi:MAG: 3-deoxy-D-manno-octulosonic acid transferase [Acidobacteriota bacterium]
MLLLYKILTWLAVGLAPFYILATLVRRPRDVREVAERFGVLSGELVETARGGLWIQAASVGELQIARLLSRSISARHPDLPIVLSATTPTARAVSSCPVPGTVGYFTFPLDLPPVAARIVRLLRPRLFIAVETEIWPNLYQSFHRRGIPVALVNGRISDRSLEHKRWLRGPVAHALSAVALVCARGAEDAARFRRLGVPTTRVVNAGDIKFDRSQPQKEEIASDVLHLARGHRVLVAGSTYGNEEEVVLAGARRAGATEEDPLLVILAPRHREHLPEVELLLERSGLPWIRRTSLSGGAAWSPGALQDGIRVLLLDTHGEMAALFAMADVAFLGGTLVPVGGHNPLEAAVAGVPQVAGPYLENVTEAVQVLSAAGALLVAADGQTAARHLGHLLAEAQERHRRGNAAVDALAAHRGALSRTLSLLDPLLQNTAPGAPA